MQPNTRNAKNSRTPWLTLLCCLVFSGSLYAQCSAYMHQAAINEISTNHNWKPSSLDFVELRLIDSSISSSIYNSWAVYVCTNVCLWTHVSNFTKIDSYLVRGNGAYSATIDWNSGFEVWLIDQYGFTIDYVSVNGNNVLYPSCTTPRDATATSDNSTRRTRRLPDANGDWDTPPGNSEPATEGANNTTPPANAVTLALADATAIQGNDMVFNLSLPSNVLSVTITYSTLDGTATAGTDYTSTTGTLTVPAGTTSATITVPTLASGSPGTFYLLLESVTNANAPDQFAAGIITELTETIDHFRYEYDGNALTCESETVTIKACANADCSTLYGSNVALTFQAQITEGTSVSSNLSFTGSTTITVAESTVTTVTMSKTASSPSGTLACYKNGVLDANCNYTTSDSGFIFLNESDSNQIIPTQLSGKPSNTGYNSKTIVLQAVQTNTTTGACTALFANNTDVSIDLSHQCENPSNCITTINNGNDFTITNNSNSYNLSKYPSYSTHSLRFGADSKATIVMNYPDAGQVKLHAQKSITLLAGEVKLMAGNTNSFVVRPFGFALTLVDANPVGSDNTSDVFARAGVAFNTTVSAVQWVDGEDNNDDGIPNNPSALGNNPVTLNFGNEISAEGATVTSALVSPTGGINSPLGNGGFTGFNSGTRTNGLTWPNVGIINLNVTLDGDGKYLELANVDDATAFNNSLSNVGRFAPDHFTLTASSIDLGCTNFSYMAQPFSVSFEVQAQGANNEVLSNYDSGIGTGNDNHALATLAFAAENSDSGVDLGGRLTALGGSWSNGSYSVSITPDFSRNADLSIDGPFDNVFVGVSVNDGDSRTVVNLAGADMNADTTGDCLGNCTAQRLQTQGQVGPTELSYRYGRLNSSEVFGPATEGLTFPLVTEFFSGTEFTQSTDDSCSTVLASEINLSGSAVTPFDSINVLKLEDNSTVGTTTIDTIPDNTTTTTVSAASGNMGLVLNAPEFTGGNTTGYVPVFVELANYPWLQFDWDTNGTGAVETTLPVKNVTFGQFRGNDRVIYWREKK